MLIKQNQDCVNRRVLLRNIALRELRKIVVKFYFSKVIHLNDRQTILFLCRWWQ